MAAVRKGPDPFCTTMEALEAISLPPLRGRRVLVKPNVGRAAPPGLGITTHPEVVAAVIEFVGKQQPARLAIGESPIIGVKAFEAMEAAGIAAVARESGVELLDLDDGPPHEVAVPNGRILESVKLTSKWKEFDFVVSVPVMKTHMHTRVSLSLKNMKGVVWRREKVRFHQLRTREEDSTDAKALDFAIADLATVAAPDLAVIDGTIGQEGMGPSAGTPKPVGIVVAGTDFLAADAVAARLMGFDPKQVAHLRLAADRAPGTLDLATMEVDPTDYMKFAVTFEPPPEDIAIEFPNVEVSDCESCSACLSTVSLFLKRYYGELAEMIGPDGRLCIAIGKGKHEPKSDGVTVFVGNCTERFREHGIHVQGCPPVASDVRRSVLDALSERHSS
jgi:uncharacterized protein (DUF362 family)